MLFDAPDNKVYHSDGQCQNGQARHDTSGVEHGLGVVDEKSNSSACADVFANNGRDDGVAHTETQAGEYPCHRSWKINVPDNLELAGAEYAGILQQHWVDVFESLVGVEEDDKEYQGHDDDHLGEETKPKPQYMSGAKAIRGRAFSTPMKG